MQGPGGSSTLVASLNASLSSPTQNGAHTSRSPHDPNHMSTEAYTVKPQDGSLGANPDLSKSASDVPVSEARQVLERLTRPSVPALDTILGQPFRFLDDGFVRVLDYTGDDGAVVRAARVSYGAGTKRVHEDRASFGISCETRTPRHSRCVRSNCTCACPWTNGASGSVTVQRT